MNFAIGRLVDGHKVVRRPEIPLEVDVLGDDEREARALVGIAARAAADELPRAVRVDHVGWRGERLARPFAHGLAVDGVNRYAAEVGDDLLIDIGDHREGCACRDRAVRQRPAQELVAVLRGRRERHGRATIVCARTADDTLAALNASRHRHHLTRSLCDGVRLARDDDLAGTLRARVVVRIGEAYRAAARAGIVAALNRNPRLGGDRVPNLPDGSRNAHRSRARVTAHRRC